MSSRSDVLVLSALLVMAFATCIAVITRYYLYRWQRILTSEGKVVTIPEELIAPLTTIDSELRVVQSAVTTTDTAHKKQGAQIYQAIERTNNVITQLFEASSATPGIFNQDLTPVTRWGFCNLSSLTPLPHKVTELDAAERRHGR
jgi:hypothetical protein